MPGTILVVDDEEPVRKLIAEILQSEDYEVITANSGRQALRNIRESAGEIAAVVTSVMLPDMTGRVLYEAIALPFPNLPFLFISGYPGANDWLQGNDAVGFLMKPFRPDELIDAVQKLIRR